MVKWTFKLAALILALSVGASPLAACMVSGDTVAEAERECCRHMADHCGSAMMPDSHSCCKVTVRHSDSYLANSRFTPGLSHSEAAQLNQAAAYVPETPHHEQFFTQTHSPPVSPPGSISVLRI